VQSHVRGRAGGGRATRRAPFETVAQSPHSANTPFPSFPPSEKDDGEHTPARCVADDASFLVVFGKSSIEEKKDVNNSPLGYYADRVVSWSWSLGLILNVMWGRDRDLSCVEWDCIEPMAIYAPLDIVGLGREKK
jgi:hypothetical protein